MARILLVDDSIVSLKQVSLMLGADHDVLIAKSGAEALQMCIHEKPDLILLDKHAGDGWV